MMRSEPHEEDPCVNMVCRSDATIGEDKRKQPREDLKFRMVPTKEPESKMEHVKETFKEAKKIFMEASTSGSKDQLSQEWILLCLLPF